VVVKFRIPFNTYKKCPTDVVIGANIRRLRKASGLSQEKLAACLRINQAAICRIERGEQRATVQLLYILSIGFDVSFDDFFVEYKQ
jgi:transcriptional regulator with XRE-family HTH domain